MTETPGSAFGAALDAGLALADRVAELERERDRLGRQYQSFIDLAHTAEAEKRLITPGEIYQLLITDPGDAT